MTICIYILSIRPFSSRACGKSLLLPSTKTGIPVSCCLSRRLCNSFLDASILSASAASTIYLQWKEKKFHLFNITHYFTGKIFSKIVQISNQIKKTINKYYSTYTIALTPLQYLSHMARNRGWPPISQTFKKKQDNDKMICIFST